MAQGKSKAVTGEILNDWVLWAPGYSCEAMRLCPGLVPLEVERGGIDPKAALGVSVAYPVPSTG